MMRETYVIGVVASCMLFSLTSCFHANESRVVATIGDEEIHLSTINRLIEKDIYINLCRIHDIQMEAINEYVGMTLLRKSSEEKGISIDSLLNSFCDGRSKGGDEYEYKKRKLLDSLFVSYDAKIILEEPIAPLIKTEEALLYTLGPLDSNVTVTELSDFDCGLCSYMHRGYKRLKDKYGDRVRFSHSVFSSDVSQASRAAYAAGLQDKYWEMADTLFAMTERPDSATIMNVAILLGLDMGQFVNDFTSVDNINMLRRNNAYLSSCGVERTLTILINGHPLRHPEDIEYIDNQIDRAINENH